MEYHDRFEQGVVIDERTTHEESRRAENPSQLAVMQFFLDVEPGVTDSRHRDTARSLHRKMR